MIKQCREWRDNDPLARQFAFPFLAEVKPIGSKPPDLSWGMNLRKALSEVPAAGQAVLVLHFLEGFALDEVSVILEIPLGTVRSSLNYGLKQLRQRFS